MAAQNTTSGPSAIVKIETFRVPPRWLFVRIETADGLVGWGEATLEGHTEAVEGMFEEYRDIFLGRSADDIEDIWQTGYRQGFYRGGPVMMSALSGLDIALWDRLGKKLGVPVWQLLGGKVRERCQVYAWIGGDRPGDVEAQAKARLEQGFRAVKMNATESLGWLDSPAALDAAVARLKAVKALGLDAGVDFHGRVHKPMAKQLAKALEPHKPLFIEEPLLPTQVAEFKQLSGSTSCPIATGERLFTRQEFRPYLEASCVDIIQPDVAHCGGISELRRIASFAETYDVALAPHCPMGPLALAACLAVDFVSPNFAIQELSWGIHYNVGEYDLFSYLTDAEVFAVKDGYIGLPRGSGLGVTINEDLVREVAKNAKAWRSPGFRGANGEIREW